MRPSFFLSALLGLNALSLPLRAQQAAPAAAPPAPAEQAPAAPDVDGRDEAPRDEAAPNTDAPNAAPRDADGARHDNRRQQSEMRLRAMMSDLGLEDAAKQDAVIAYLAEDEAGKNKVRGAQRRLWMAVKRGTEPQRTRDLIAIYKATLDADKERRSAAQGALDAKIAFSQDPRVEAALWLFGVLGDGQSVPMGGIPGRPGPNRNPDFGAKPRDGAPNAALLNGAITVMPNLGKPRPNAQEVCGKVERKGPGWIEVRDQGGTLERYFSFWTAQNRGAANEMANNGANGANGYDRSVLEAIRAAPIGAAVRLQWVWSEKKRVVHLEPWLSPQLTLPTHPDALPAPTNPDQDAQEPQTQTQPETKP